MSSTCSIPILDHTTVLRALKRTVVGVARRVNCRAKLGDTNGAALEPVVSQLLAERRPGAGARRITEHPVRRTLSESLANTGASRMQAPQAALA
jgi:hypothetical protein